MLTRCAFLRGAAKALAALGLARALPAAGATEPDWLAIEGEALAYEPVIAPGDVEAIGERWQEQFVGFADPLDAARERWPDVDWDDAFAVEVERPHTLVTVPYRTPAVHRWIADILCGGYRSGTYGDWMLGKGWMPTDPLPAPPGYHTSYHWRPVLAWRRAA